MKSEQEIKYRLKLAQGFLAEAQQDVPLKRWRSAVDNSQLAVENAAKAVLAMLGPVGRTHNPAVQLLQAIADGRFTPIPEQPLHRLAELAKLMGADVHAQTDYGIEAAQRTPWELFGEADAQQAVTVAEEAMALAQAITQYHQEEGDA